MKHTVKIIATTTRFRPTRSTCSNYLPLLVLVVLVEAVLLLLWLLGAACLQMVGLYHALVLALNA